MRSGRALLCLGRAFLTNPIGLAVTALVIAAYMIYKHWGKIKAAWREGAQRAIEECKKLKAGIKELWEDLRNCLGKMFSAGKEIDAGLADGLTSAVRARSGQRPAVIAWENVPGVFSTQDNAFGRLAAGLAGIDPGGGV